MTRRVATADCETDPFKKGRIPRPFVWGFYDGDEYREFWGDTQDDFAEFLGQQDVICYMHNGGKFDFHYLIEYFDAWDNIKIINGRIAQCQIGLCELRDSYCIIAEPLGKYKKDDIDYRLMERGTREKNKTEIGKYLRGDCVYLYEMVSEFRRLYGDALTQAGAAMKYWVNLSGETPEYTDENFYNLFAPYYFGGRVECFESGIIDTNFSVYDINSAYPRAMLEKHPYSANYEHAEGYLPNADFYKIQCVSRGALPFRGLGGGDGVSAGLSFPSDNRVREYTVSHWEVKAGIDTKTVSKIKYLESFRFMRHTDFSIYIDHFWTLRAEAKRTGDVLGSLMYKLMMNSLYGKWAANPDNYKNYMIAPPEHLSALGAGVRIKRGKGKPIEWQYGGELGCWLLAERPLDDFQKRYYNVATGASITGFVRAMLWRAIHSSKGVIYCDTDSIAVRAKGAGVIIGDKLGEWKHEGDFDRAGIGGKKLYIFRGLPGAGGLRDYKTASKGARLTDAELWKIAAGGEVNYEREVPTYSVTKPLNWSNPEKSFTNRKIVNTARKGL